MQRDPSCLRNQNSICFSLLFFWSTGWHVISEVWIDSARKRPAIQRLLNRGNTLAGSWLRGFFLSTNQPPQEHRRFPSPPHHSSSMSCSAKSIIKGGVTKLLYCRRTSIKVSGDLLVVSSLPLQLQPLNLLLTRYKDIALIVRALIKIICFGGYAKMTNGLTRNNLARD